MKNSTNTFKKMAGRALAALLFLSLFYTTSLFAQSVWTGAVNSNWNNAANWTGGVPAAGKTVTIYTCTTCPVINNAGNQSAFVQVYAGGKLTIGASGSLSISNPGGPGLKTHATSQVNVNQGGSLTIQSFWGEGLAVGGTFQNGGTININGGHTGIAVSAGASFTNNVNGSTTVTGSSLNYAMTSSGTVLNNGALTLDDANNDGINQPIGTITNGQNGTLTITKTGVNGIFTKGTFNNNGLLHIDNGLNGIYLLFGTFNNNANGELFVTGSSFLNEGIYVDPGTFKNSGELTIRNALSKGIEISGGSTFNNFNEITLDVPAWAGIFNVGGSNFSNKPCALIQGPAAIINYATFTNSGIIFESSPGNSQIGQNNGTVINLNGGSFSVSGGNAVVAEGGTIVWTGCSSTNWTDANNWIPVSLPTPGLFSKAVVQNVAQASGNAPVVSTTTSSPPIYLQKNANLTIASGGTLNLSESYLGNYLDNSYVEVGQAAKMTVQAGGAVNSNGYSILSGNVVNSGIINILAPFHSAGSFGLNGGSFTNNAGGQLFGTVGQSGSGVQLGLANNAVFTNNGGVTLSGFGSINLDHSSLTNKPGKSITIGGGPGQGSISVSNGSTFLNQGSLSSGDLKTYDSSFTNSGTLHLGNKSPGLYGEDATYTNSGTMTLTNAYLLVWGGIFDNTGSIKIENAPNNAFNNTCQFTNSGSLEVQYYTPTTYTAMVNLGGQFTNTPTGSVWVRGMRLGLINWAGFTNKGILKVENASGRGIEHNSSTPFRNESTGKIIINGAAEIGFAVFQPLINAGRIEINNIADQGLYLSTPFENLSTGKLIINQVGTYALNSNVSTKNYGTIDISNSNFEGIACAGHFENYASGVITVLQNLPSAWPSISNGGPFYNSGTVNFLGDNLKSITNGAVANFVNRQCAILNINGLIINNNSITNQGLFKSTFTGVNQNPGNFTNTGVIEDFYGSFNGIGYNNAAVRVRPIAGQVGGFIQNALEIGFSSPFQIGTTWYQNANLTNPGGTYISGVNTFTPTVGVGTHTLYFTVKDLVNNCTKTVSVQVSISSAMKGEGLSARPAITLTNYPNPFAENTTIKLSLPFEAEGKLVVYDNLGRLVEVMYEGYFLKDELYEFTFDASGKRVASYLASLVLSDGRAFSIRLIKAETR